MKYLLLLWMLPLTCISKFNDTALTKGTYFCNKLPTYQGDDVYGQPNGLNEVYYDGESVYYSIGKYLNNSYIKTTCSQNAEIIYKDRYVNGTGAGKCNGGNCPGYWNFTNGLTKDFINTADISSKNTALSLSDNASFCRDVDTVTCDVTYLREYSYCLEAQNDAEFLGATRNAKHDRLANCLVSLVPAFTAPSFDTAPFMVGLWAKSLIREYQTTSSALLKQQILQSVTQAADWLYSNMLLTGLGYSSLNTFKYRKITDPYPAPDLNLLIAPMYSWVYCITKVQKYLDRYDNLFCGGVEPSGSFPSGKQFDQSYFWSIPSVTWREGQTCTFDFPTSVSNCVNSALDVFKVEVNKCF